MKFIIAPAELLRALRGVKACVEGRQSLPVLTCVLVSADAEKNQVVITGTNLEQEMTVRSAVMVSDAGAAAVCLRTLLSVVAGASCAELECEMRGETLRLAGRNFCAELLTLPAEDFPAWSGDAEAETWTMPAKALGDGLNAVLPYVSMDETRYTLNGVFFEAKAGEVALVATDGRRLSTVTLEADASPAQAIVPYRAACILRDLSLTVAAEDDTAIISIGVGDRGVAVETPGASLRSRTIEGNYANWRQVIPVAGEGWGVPPGAWLQAVRSVKPLAPDAELRIDVEGEIGGVVFRADDRERGSVQANAESDHKRAFLRAYNGDFLEAMLAGAVRWANAAGSDSVMVEMTGDDSSPGPMTIRQGRWLAVLMPLRVK
jgi:DNA polymerase III subunit beta